MNHIDISEIVRDFHHHVVMNKNIIFSGAFGSGKSYMIDEFKRTYRNEFNVITIYPINYVISGNADIVEYIKHDIIYQLVLQGYITERTDFSTISSSVFTTENFTRLTTHILDNLPGGGLIADAIRIGLEAKEKRESEKHTVANYLEGFNRAGSIYERDVYTEMIRLGLDAGRREGKKWLLVVEDIDRIDPHNIFRLLNVFGAHFDCRYVAGEEAEPNKFGLDKVVFVLDYQQTNEIYNRYFGLDSNSSWEGYISKFLTSQPFYFEGVAGAAKNMVLRDVAQNCRLDYKIIEVLFTQDYSIRTLSKVSFEGFETFLRTDKIELPGGAFLAVDSRLTRLLYYFQQLNGGIGRLKEIMEENPMVYLEIVAPALLYHHQSSCLYIDYSSPIRCDDYVDCDIDDEKEEDRTHTYYNITVSDDGAAEVKEVVIVGLSTSIKPIEISTDDSYSFFVVEVLAPFCSRFTRYNGR